MWKNIFRIKYLTTPFVLTKFTYRIDDAWVTYTEGFVFGIRVIAIRH